MSLSWVGELDGTWALAFYQFRKTSLLAINWRAADRASFRVREKKMAYRGGTLLLSPWLEKGEPCTQNGTSQEIFSKKNRISASRKHLACSTFALTSGCRARKSSTPSLGANTGGKTNGVRFQHTGSTTQFGQLLTCGGRNPRASGAPLYSDLLS